MTDGAAAVCDIEIVTLDRWPGLLLDDDPSASWVVALILNFFRQAIAPDAPSGICEACARRCAAPGALLAAAIAAWKRWVPDLRKIDVSDQVGNA